MGDGASVHAGRPQGDQRWLGWCHQALGFGLVGVLALRRAAERQPEALNELHGLARAAGGVAQRARGHAALAAQRLGNHAPSRLLPRALRRHLRDPCGPELFLAGLRIQGPHRPSLGHQAPRRQVRGCSPCAHRGGVGPKVAGKSHRLCINGQDRPHVGHPRAGRAHRHVGGALGRGPLRGLPGPHGAERLPGHLAEGLDGHLRGGRPHLVHSPQGDDLVMKSRDRTALRCGLA
mmetsp:Transcript_60338/g.153348  ORF Transcript_60338/g.153348 Transcript_60338/m.153348 type:complete len:234 (+) Transcript_60338:185-886(+)